MQKYSKDSICMVDGNYYTSFDVYTNTFERLWKLVEQKKFSQEKH